MYGRTLSGSAEASIYIITLEQFITFPVVSIVTNILRFKT